MLAARLADARQLGHPVLALVRGSAVNQDGASGRLATPMGRRSDQITAALASAQLGVADVDVVEGWDGHHVGSSRRRRFWRVAADRPLWLGSIKSRHQSYVGGCGVAG